MQTRCSLLIVDDEVLVLRASRVGPLVSRHGPDLGPRRRGSRCTWNFRALGQVIGSAWWRLRQLGRRSRGRRGGCQIEQEIERDAISADPACLVGEPFRGLCEAARPGQAGARRPPRPGRRGLPPRRRGARQAAPARRARGGRRVCPRSRGVSRLRWARGSGIRPCRRFVQPFAARRSLARAGHRLGQGAPVAVEGRHLNSADIAPQPHRRRGPAPGDGRASSSRGLRRSATPCGGPRGATGTPGRAGARSGPRRGACRACARLTP